MTVTDDSLCDFVTSPVETLDFVSVEFVVTESSTGNSEIFRRAGYITVTDSSSWGIFSEIHFSTDRHELQ